MSQTPPKTEGKLNAEDATKFYVQALSLRTDPLTLFKSKDITNITINEDPSITKILVWLSPYLFGQSSAINTKLGPRIRELRLAKHISAIEIAHLLDISQSRLSNWETTYRAATISMAQLLDLSNALDISPDIVILGTPFNHCLQIIDFITRIADNFFLPPKPQGTLSNYIEYEKYTSLMNSVAEDIKYVTQEQLGIMHDFVSLARQRNDALKSAK